MDQVAFSMFGAAPIFGSGILYGLIVVHHLATTGYDNKVATVLGASLLGLTVMWLAAYWMGGADLIRVFIVLGPISLFAGFTVRYGVMKMISEQYRLSRKAQDRLSGAGVNDDEWQPHWGKHGPLVILVFGVLCGVLAMKMHVDDLIGIPGEPSGINFWHYFGLIYPGVLLGVPVLRKTIRDWSGEYFFAVFFVLSSSVMLTFISMLKTLFFG